MSKSFRTYEISKISKKDISEIKKTIQAFRNNYGKSKYFVEFDGEIYPLKNFFYAILKVYNKDIKINNINTSFVLNFIKNLGLKILTKQEAMLKFASAIELGGNSVEEEKEIYSD